jgi:hypothetical protein
MLLITHALGADSGDVGRNAVTAAVHGGKQRCTALLGFQIHLSYFPFVGFPLITSQSAFCSYKPMTGAFRCTRRSLSFRGQLRSSTAL